MLRLVGYLLITIFLITIIRSVVGIVMKGFFDALGFSPRAASSPAPAPNVEVPLSGELKKDPVCGTYTSAATSLHRTVRGQTFYFCSETCRDKFLART